MTSCQSILKWTQPWKNRGRFLEYWGVCGRVFRLSPHQPVVRRSICSRSNRLFASYLKPRYQSEAWCTTIHMKMSLICMWTRIEKETKTYRKASHSTKNSRISGGRSDRMVIQGRNFWEKFVALHRKVVLFPEIPQNGAIPFATWNFRKFKLESFVKRVFA